MYRRPVLAEELNVKCRLATPGTEFETEAAVTTVMLTGAEVAETPAAVACSWTGPFRKTSVNLNARL